MNTGVALYTAMIRERVHFAEASYRDGEWKAILGYVGSNVDGTDYHRDLREALTHTLLEPVGQWCVFWPGDSQPHVHKEARAWIEKHRPPVSWIPDRVLARANIAGEARPFFEAVRGRSVVLVGGSQVDRHQALIPVIGPYRSIEVHPTASWREAERVASHARHLVDEYGADLVLFAAGMGSNLMIHRLWPSVRGRATLIDVGAMLDPYAGKFSRSAYQDRAWREDVMPRNIAA